LLMRLVLVRLGREVLEVLRREGGKEVRLLLRMVKLLLRLPATAVTRIPTRRTRLPPIPPLRRTKKLPSSSSSHAGAIRKRTKRRWSGRRSEHLSAPHSLDRFLPFDLLFLSRFEGAFELGAEFSTLFRRSPSVSEGRKESEGETHLEFKTVERENGHLRLVEPPVVGESESSELVLVVVEVESEGRREGEGGLVRKGKAVSRDRKREKAGDVP
jgi:hypothetical protein